jgi:pyridoxal/pyridoxine/pyridoxamine kinase
VSALGLADVVVPNRTELAILADAPVARTQDEVVAQVGSLGLPRPWS